jgi:hypothetical protein
MAISKLKRFIIRPNGVDWKKSSELCMTDSANLLWRYFRELFPANWADGVAIIARIMHNPDK